MAVVVANPTNTPDVANPTVTQVVVVTQTVLSTAKSDGTRKWPPSFAVAALAVVGGMWQVCDPFCPPHQVGFHGVGK